MIADHRAISAFLDAKAAESGSARNTVLAYGRDLRDLSEWLAARGLALADLTRERVEDYRARLRAADAARQPTLSFDTSPTRARALSPVTGRPLRGVLSSKAPR